MGYSVPNTFTDATVIDASKIQENLDEIKEYLDGTIVAGDYATAWVRAKHLMSGYYYPVNNQHRFISGLIGGKTFTVDSKTLSWLGNAPTLRVATNEESYIQMPNTAVTFTLEDTADVLFQFYGRPFMPAISGGGTAAGQQAQLYIYVDGVQKAATKSVTLLEVTDQKERNYLSNFFMAEDLAAGEHTIEIRGLVEAPFMLFIAWGMSFEAYYQ